MKAKPRQKYLSLIYFIVPLAILLVITFQNRTKIASKISNSPTPITPTPTFPYQAVTEGEISMQESSPDNKSFYSILSIENTQRDSEYGLEAMCHLKIRYQGKDQDLTKLLRFDSISCSTSMGFTESDVRGWIGNDFLSIYHLNNEVPELISLDLKNQKTYIHKPTKDFPIMAHSDTLSSYIYSDTSTNKFFLANSDESQMINLDYSPLLEDGYTFTNIIFDIYNQCYLFIAQKQYAVNDKLYPGDMVYRIAKVSETDPKLKIVYTTPRISIWHPMETLTIVPSGKNKLLVPKQTKSTADNPQGHKEMYVPIN